MDTCDVLVVGAGPTGLALAAHLHAYGVSVRVIDKALDRARESRALAVQPRTLEVLRNLGVADELVRRGNPSVRLKVHAGSRVAQLQLFDIGVDDTAYPFMLFLSQAETEAVLSHHLDSSGVQVEHGVAFEGYEIHADDGLMCTLRFRDGASRERPPMTTPRPPAHPWR